MTREYLRPHRYPQFNRSLEAIKKRSVLLVPAEVHAIGPVPFGKKYCTTNSGYTYGSPRQPYLGTRSEWTCFCYRLYIECEWSDSIFKSSHQTSSIRYRYVILDLDLILQRVSILMKAIQGPFWIYRNV